MVKDLTKGKINSTLISFTLPMFISVVFQQMYNIADSIIAGKYAGKLALAAVGASYPVTMIFIAIALGASIGVSVVISQLFGKGEMGKMKSAINTSLVSVFVLSILLTIAGTFLCTPILQLLNTSNDIFTDSKLYLDIYVWGLTFLLLYNICTGVFTALGDSKTPLYLLIGSSIGNIVLDYIFVANFGWGVAGVGWATFIAQGTACVLAFVLLLRRIKKLNIKENSKIFSVELLKKISYIAVPSILQQSFVSVGQLFIQGLINSLGTDVTAGYSAAIKLNTFAVTCFCTIGNAISNFTAQNIGAYKLDRVRAGCKSGLMMVMAIAIPFILLFTLFSEMMIGLFMDLSETAAVHSGVLFLKIVSPFFLFVSVKLVFDSVLRGAAAIKMFTVTTFSDLIIRVVLSYILVNYYGDVGIWMSWPIGWMLSAALSFVFYKSGKWTKTSLA